MLISGLPSFSIAQEPEENRPTETVKASDERTNETMTVLGKRVDMLPDTGSTSTLSGDELARQLQSTLGATLDEELGVHNASFGPGVGLPVVRGLTGPRVRMLQNGIGTHDASAASPDHAVAVDALTAEKINIVRGADVVRYGGSAIGGAVEVVDGRIPKERQEDLVDGAIEARYGNNPKGHSAAFKLNVGYDYVGFHVDGFDRASGNVDIPGGSLDEPAVREQFGEFVEFQNSFGKLRNSDAESRGGAVGASIVGDQGFLGASVSSLSNAYGIPPGGLPPHTDVPGQAPQEERIRIDIQHDRRDIQSEYKFDSRYINSLSVHAANVDYRHHETDSNRVSTTFRNDVIETRSELDYTLSGWANGSAGVHWQKRKFGAVGLEVFVPESDIDTLGAYLIQKFEFSNWGFELGFRRETVTTRPDDTTRQIGGIISVNLPDELEYTAYAGSVALNVDITDNLSTRAAYNYTQRAPDVQELLALGPHLSTRTFDVGNTGLNLETSRAIELGVVYDMQFALFEIDLYHRDIADFIYQENLGFVFDIEEQLFKLSCVRIDGCITVFGYQQQDAKFLGFESRIIVPFETPIGGFRITAFTDNVRGYFIDDGAGSVPRLPPRSYGGTLEFERESWYTKVRVARHETQSRAGLNESITPGYTALSAEASYRFSTPFNQEGFAFIRAHNLLNADIRNATSFLRAFMPEPGRSLDAGVRFEF